MATTASNWGVGILALCLSGCASQTGWTPTVDPYNDPNAARIQVDMMDCKQLAQQASNDPALETTKGAAFGGFLGAATGAVIGAITGNAASGAAIGAVTGGASGAASQGLGSNDSYKRSYSNCMRNRGHSVLD
jgi:outer membrane lipoprotein SlyB